VGLGHLARSTNSTRPKRFLGRKRGSAAGASEAAILVKFGRRASELFHTFGDLRSTGSSAKSWGA
jgi:hypothetical protein